GSRRDQRAPPGARRRRRRVRRVQAGGVTRRRRTRRVLRRTPRRLQASAEVVIRHRAPPQRDRESDEAQAAGTGRLDVGQSAERLPVGKARLETFSDGVFAIAITLLVLTIPTPDDFQHLGAGLRHQWPAYAAFLVSFAVIGIMWLNHHTVFGHF